MMKFVNVLKKIQGAFFFIGLTIVGCGFVIFNLLPIIMPDKWTDETNNPVMTIAFIVMGLAAAIFGIYNIIKVVKTTPEEANYFDKVNTAEVDPKVVEGIKNSGEPTEEYYFHFCGKLNQSYIMETPDRKPVYEMNCDKMGVINDYIYTFKSHVSGDEFTCNISHTITTSTDSGGLELVQNSYFNIDGMKIWDYIGQMGYSIEPYIDGIAFSYKVKHYGVEVAEIKAAGTNILEEYEGKGGLRDIAMMEGLYRIYCRESDVDACALIAFAVARVQIM